MTRPVCFVVTCIAGKPSYSVEWDTKANIIRREGIKACIPITENIAQIDLNILGQAYENGFRPNNGD